MGPMSRSQLRQERDCASEASRSNVGIETCEGDFYAWCGDKLSPLRSGWGQLVPTSPAWTAEIMKPMSRIQSSLRDLNSMITFPGVETPGYFREVPPGLPSAAKALNFRKAFKAERGSGQQHYAIKPLRVRGDGVGGAGLAGGRNEGVAQADPVGSGGVGFILGLVFQARHRAPGQRDHAVGLRDVLKHRRQWNTEPKNSPTTAR